MHHAFEAYEEALRKRATVDFILCSMAPLLLFLAAACLLGYALVDFLSEFAH